VSEEPKTKDAKAEADYWKQRYEDERERLVKLWVAYKSLEADFEAAKKPIPGQ
jgi:hypothetical protein